MDLQFDHFHFGKVTYKGVYLSPAAAGYVLTLVLGFRLDQEGPNGRYVIWDPKLQIDIAKKGADISVRLGNAAPWSLGHLQSFEGHAHEQDVHFEMQLSGAQLAHVEELRAGEDLPLSLRLRARASKRERTGEVIVDGRTEVARKNWLDELRKVKAADILLFEVPLPLGEVAAARTAPAEHLARARDLFLQGHYDDAVANCRKALEALAKSLGDGKELRRVQDAGADREARERFTVRERLFAIRNAVFQAANLANHAPPGATDDYSFRQADARLILASTAALVARALHTAPATRRSA